MRYWDPSAIVPLLVRQAGSRTLSKLYSEDGAVVTWWGSRVECVSALARLERDGHVVGSTSEAARMRLRLLHDGWQEVDPSDRLRQTATRVLRVHPLRAADALQLAAAIVASEGVPESLAFLTLDERLANAARDEGFPVVQPGD